MGLNEEGGGSKIKQFWLAKKKEIWVEVWRQEGSGMWIG